MHIKIQGIEENKNYKRLRVRLEDADGYNLDTDVHIDALHEALLLKAGGKAALTAAIKPILQERFDANKSARVAEASIKVATPDLNAYVDSDDKDITFDVEEETEEAE